MGSKTVSAGRVVQVKPHTPLTRLPNRRDNPRPKVSEVLTPSVLPPTLVQFHIVLRGSKSPD